VSPQHLDRAHWSFDPAAYRRAQLAHITDPRAIAAAFMAATAFAGFVLLAVSAGAA
jgi:hypothetical protein